MKVGKKGIFKFIVICVFLVIVTASHLFATEYIAFSLKVAQDRILSTPKGKNYRELNRDIFTLAQITTIIGLVYDRKAGDVILVGERDAGRATITLDDFVVALRARFIHDKWPLVSIDPTEETEKTGIQKVRYEGAIEDTQLGKDLLDADYTLKKIGMGIIPFDKRGASYWDINKESAKQETIKSWIMNSRFWFYMVLPGVFVKDDVIAIKKAKYGIFFEELSQEIDGTIYSPYSPYSGSAIPIRNDTDLSTIRTLSKESGKSKVEFTTVGRDIIDGFSKVHESLLKIEGLGELVALSRAMEELEKKQNLSYWLESYKVNKVDTKREVAVLKRKDEFGMSEGDKGSRRYILYSGCFELISIPIRLQGDNLKLLKESVLKSRPGSDALSWNFKMNELPIPSAYETSGEKDIPRLFAKALFLQEKECYDDAITIYGSILKYKPDFDWCYNYRGNAYCKSGHYEQAISDFNKAIDLNPGCASAFYNRGVSYYFKKEYDKSWKDIQKAQSLGYRVNQEFIESLHKALEKK